VGPDGEPLADWELEVLADSQGNTGSAGTSSGGDQNRNRSKDRERDNNKVKATENRDDADPNNRRNRRRGRGRGREREEAGNEPISTDPVPVDGYLDLRDEGYGFLRVNGNLPSKEDVYVSVKQVRQYGLRKGDHLSGLSRPANRNEKNPGFHQIDSVNGGVPEEARNRVRFEDLTPVFPDERLIMELPDEPENLTTRILDLVAPIGKGQRGLIVSPPKSGKTSVLKDIVRAIEINNPEVHLMVLLVDERPEEVTDMRRHLTSGEVAASTFDRPPEEHCAVAELTLERAKRQVEAGDDVCIVLDGITRLARAYNLSGTQTGRPVSAGVDAGALYPAKRFFGAARNLEEGGSLTILATALVETGSKVDEAIFEEFIDTANLELRLDRLLADKRVFPAIDVDRSSTRNEELLFDDGDKELSWKLRRALAEKRSDNGSASASSAELLIERLKAAESNRAFLDEIAKAPSI
jgi:transcription termination factor Rho